MLSQNFVNELVKKWQTTNLNVTREYLQHLLLAQIYEHPESKNLAFKDGTALRLAFGSPRFSEDLDFSGNIKPFKLKKIIEDVCLDVGKANVDIAIEESKPTSGGYFAILSSDILNQHIRIEINISSRGRILTVPTMITTMLVPSYSAILLNTRMMVSEKVSALLTRKKARDFFDIYFLLKQRIEMNEIIAKKSAILFEANKIDGRSIQRELKLFLPVSHHRIISSFPKVLVDELNRY